MVAVAVPANHGSDRGKGPQGVPLSGVKGQRHHGVGLQQQLQLVVGTGQPRQPSSTGQAAKLHPRRRSNRGTGGSRAGAGGGGTGASTGASVRASTRRYLG